LIYCGVWAGEARKSLLAEKNLFCFFLQLFHYLKNAILSGLTKSLYT